MVSTRSSTPSKSKPSTPTSKDQFDNNAISTLISSNKYLKLVLDDQKIYDYKKYHKGGIINIEQALTHPDSLLLFHAYHASANPKYIAQQLNNMSSDTSIIDDEDVMYMRDVVTKATKDNQLALNLYALYRIILSWILLPLGMIWRTIDCNSFIGNGILMFSMISYAFTIFHMRHHIGRSFDNYWLNKISTMYYDLFEAIFVIPPRLWIDHHNLSHHVYTNLTNDYDTTTPYPFIRIHPAQEYQWYHKYQAIYTIPLLGFNSFLFNKFNLEIGTWWSYSCFIINYLVLIVLPVFNGATWSQSFLSYFIFMFSISIPTALLFQVSHNHPDNHTNHDIKPTTYREWLQLQYKESMSWGGLFSCIVFGGINYQTEHHLWPAVQPILLHCMIEDSRKLCKKLKCKYTYESTFWEATMQYVLHLHKLSNPNEGIDYIKK